MNWLVVGIEGHQEGHVRMGYKLIVWGQKEVERCQGGEWDQSKGTPEGD